MPRECSPQRLGPRRRGSTTLISRTLSLAGYARAVRHRSLTRRPTRLVGRPRRARGRSTGRSTERSSAARTRRARAGRRAGHRQDAAAGGARLRAPTARRWLVLSGSASELEGELPFWVFVDALDEYVYGLEPRRLDAHGRRRARRARRTSCPRCPAARRLPLERYRTHRAMRQLLETLAPDKPLRARCSTTSTGPTRARSSCSARCCGARRRAVLIALGGAPAPARRSGCSASLERASRAGRHADTARARGPVDADEARRAARRGRRGPRRRLYDESGGNPFYLQQLAAVPGGRRRLRGDVARRSRRAGAVAAS